MRTVLRHAASFAIAAMLVGASFSACSLGQGDGQLSGYLNVPDCWSGQFNLSPDFFAAVPYRESLQLRIQNGADYQTFSDGISILIENINIIRPQPLADGGTSAGELNIKLPVSLPPGVVAPGVPIIANSNPARVSVSLYLQRTCRTQDVALYALDAVSLNAAGGCNPSDGQPIFTCPGQYSDGTQAAPVGDAGADAAGGADAGNSADAGDGGAPVAKIGSSWIQFSSLFDNNVDESSAELRLNKGTFGLYLADPREACAGGIGPPPPCRGYVEGYFNFYFERGRPAQPFP